MLSSDWVTYSKGQGLGQSGERWALPLPSPLNATHVSDTAFAVLS
jgi:hypothetical protein